MTRLLVATVALTLAAAPAFACELEKSVSNDGQKQTATSQPGHSTPPHSASSDQKRS